MLSFRDKTKQSANWLASGLHVPCDFIHYRCRSNVTGSGESIGPHRARPMYRGDFSALFCAPVGRCVSTSTSLHFATYAILDIRFPKSIQAGHGWITHTRTLNCRKFSLNFTDDARELPFVQPETNYACARKFDYRSSFASRIHVHSLSMYPWYICRSVLYI